MLEAEAQSKCVLPITEKKNPKPQH